MEQRLLKRLVILLAVLALLLVACGGTAVENGPMNAVEPDVELEADESEPSVAEEPADDTVAADEAVELTIVWMGWPEEQVTPTMELFEANHPNIKLNVERIPFGEIFQALEVRLSARSDDPDVYVVDGPLTGSYAARGHLLELDPVLADEIDGFTQAAIAQGTYDGKLYSAPYASSSQLLFYNEDLFAEAGIEPPSADPAQRWTWDQVYEAATQLANPDEGIWGVVIEQADRPYQVLALPQSYGADVIGPDALTAEGYVNSPAFIEAIEFYRSLFVEGLHPVGTDNSVTPEIFGTGRTAMFIGGTWNLNQIPDRYPELNFGVAPHPYFAGGQPVTPTGSWHIGINPRSDDLEAAREFVRYMTTDPELRELWFALRAYPPVRNATFDQVPEVFDSEPWRIVVYELNNTAVPRPATPGFREYEDVLMQAFADIQLGADVMDRLTEAAQEIDAQMQKYR
jgi:ABC-type glycerol-3-phosphate transport system substrate-binding protein